MNVIPHKPAPNPDAAEQLRAMLAQVEAGEVAFVLLLGVSADGVVYDGWSEAKHVKPLTVLGALERLKLRFVRQVELM